MKSDQDQPNCAYSSIGRGELRDIFWRAYSVFKAHTLASVPALIPDSDGGGYTQPGGPRDPEWERWALWRSDFDRAGKACLRGVEERIFTLHICLGLSERRTCHLLRISRGRSFRGMISIIAEKVGASLLQRKVWPLHDDFGSGYMD